MSYGSYAQRYFGVNTDNLADTGIDMSDMTETIETINEDFEYIGMSLVCGCDIDAKAYFSNKNNDETTSGVVRPYWYINKVIQSPIADAGLKNLCKAMYIYNNAERQYFMNHIWDNWGRA